MRAYLCLSESPEPCCSTALLERHAAELFVALSSRAIFYVSLPEYETRDTAPELIHFSPSQDETSRPRGQETIVLAKAEEFMLPETPAEGGCVRIPPHGGCKMTRGISTAEDELKSTRPKKGCGEWWRRLMKEGPRKRWREWRGKRRYARNMKPIDEWFDVILPLRLAAKSDGQVPSVRKASESQ